MNLDNLELPQETETVEEDYSEPVDLSDDLIENQLESEVTALLDANYSLRSALDALTQTNQTLNNRVLSLESELGTTQDLLRQTQAANSALAQERSQSTEQTELLQKHNLEMNERLKQMEEELTLSRSRITCLESENADLKSQNDRLAETFTEDAPSNEEATVLLQSLLSKITCLRSRVAGTQSSLSETLKTIELLSEE
ncbi:hypothetical protein RCL1_003838 [Eukaryota sp. TZLM3-RCL]